MQKHIYLRTLALLEFYYARWQIMLYYLFQHVLLNLTLSAP